MRGIDSKTKLPSSCTSHVLVNLSLESDHAVSKFFPGRLLTTLWLHLENSSEDGKKRRIDLIRDDLTKENTMEIDLSLIQSGLPE